jgi:hypothetical protein
MREQHKASHPQIAQMAQMKREEAQAITMGLSSGSWGGGFEGPGLRFRGRGLSVRR